MYFKCTNRAYYLYESIDPSKISKHIRQVIAISLDIRQLRKHSSPLSTITIKI